MSCLNSSPPDRALVVNLSELAQDFRSLFYMTHPDQVLYSNCSKLTRLSQDQGKHSEEVLQDFTSIFMMAHDIKDPLCVLVYASGIGPSISEAKIRYSKQLDVSCLLISCRSHMISELAFQSQDHDLKVED